jgi:hypothetical protein
LQQSDFYTSETSNATILKAFILLKQKIMSLITFAYFSEDLKDNQLILTEMKRQNTLVTKMINEGKIRRVCEDFKLLVPMKDLKNDNIPRNKVIAELYANFYRN